MQNAEAPSRCRWAHGDAPFTPTLRIVLTLHFAFCILHGASDASAQELLDRIVARVSSTALTLTELQSARGFGIVTAPMDDAALQQLIDRQLLLIEVGRFPPAEPSEAAVDVEVARMRAAAGPRRAELMMTTGTDDGRLKDLARDTLRIEGYLDQRFGTPQEVTQDEAAAYYEAHPDEFRRGGALIPFEEALPDIRKRANADRRRTQLERWLIDLRARADIAVPTA